RLAKSGRVFGPDPATTDVTTMGGVIAVNGSGSRWSRYGAARDQVRRLKVVLAGGQAVEVGRHPFRGPPNEDDPPEVRRLVQAVGELIERRRAAIDGHSPKTLVNTSGYLLDGVLRDDRVDLAKLIAGSEGTLALIIEAEVDTQPLPAEGRCLLLVFDSLDKAARASLEMAPSGPAACDLMDRRHLSLARESDVRYELLIPGAAEAALLVEHFADDPATADGKVRKTIEIVRDELGLAAGAFLAESDEDAALLRRLSRRFVPTLHAVKGLRRAVPGIEDIALPPAALPNFLYHLQDTLKRREVTASVFGHAAHGQLHVRPLLNLSSRDDVRRLELLASDLYEKVWLLGGTISGEHGDGLSRTPFAPRQHGPLMNVYRELKRLFDPAGVLNPGKVVPLPGARMTRNLRFGDRHNDPGFMPPAPDANGSRAADAGTKGSRPPSVITLQLDWDADRFASVADSCNGCGSCRSTIESTRMCPIFRYTPREEASPRAKANLVRAALRAVDPREALEQDTVKQVADLCVHCHMCRVDCPAGVDIPRLMIEAKAAHVAANGLQPSEWWLTRIDDVSRIASRFPRLANWALSNRRARWLIEKLLGLAQGRRFPRLASRPFLATAAAKQAVIPGAAEQVLYFVDTFANYYDRPLAEQFVRVLRHNGIAVLAPGDQRHSGMPLISQGVLEPAKKLAARNVEMLAEAVRRGSKIVATEPSAVLALTHEYPSLLPDDDDAQLVAANTEEACAYLWKRHRLGKLRLDLEPMPMSVAYHVPCHVKALGRGEPAGNLMRLIPRLQLTQLEKGCSGMAGIFGLKKVNYRSSLRAGLPLLSELRNGAYELAVSECSSCQMQMRHASRRPVLHPIKLLAMSYGLAPDLLEEVRTASAAGSDLVAEAS
ncbi:MAG: FAD-linked oxidase C-terminal domain-containing protein, partial [Planctomycetota bacterium]